MRNYYHYIGLLRWTSQSFCVLSRVLNCCSFFCFILPFRERNLSEPKVHHGAMNEDSGDGEMTMDFQIVVNHAISNVPNTVET